VYTNIAGCTCTSSVVWYGKEDVYEVINLEHLGNSLGELINKQKLDHRPSEKKTYLIPTYSFLTPKIRGLSKK